MLWSPSVLEPRNAADEVNGTAVYGFVFDFCGVEIDRDTGSVRVDKYVSLHGIGLAIWFGWPIVMRGAAVLLSLPPTLDLS